MFYEEIRAGSRVVVTSANDEGGPFTVRLWVNCGFPSTSDYRRISGEARILGDPTPTVRRYKTIRAARKGAEKMMIQAHAGSL